MPYTGSALATEKWSGPTKQIQVNNAVVTAGAMRIFDVIMAIGQDDAQNACNVPLGTIYDSNNTGVLCSGFLSRQIAPGYYEVQVQYTYAPGSLSIVDPLTQPPVVQWNSVPYEIPIDRDIYGNAIVNANGDPFDPPPTKVITKKSLKITKNFRFYDYAGLTPYEGTVNSDALTMMEPNGNVVNFGPGTIRCTTVEPAGAYTKNDSYVPITASFEVYIPNDAIVSQYPDLIGHQFRALNQGSTGFYTNSSGVQKTGKFLTDRGGHITDVTNVLLDEDGIPYRGDLKVGDYDAMASPAGNPNDIAGAVFEAIGTSTTGATYVYYKRYKPIAHGPLFTTFS